MPDYPGVDFAGGVFRPASADHTKTVSIGFVDALGNTANLTLSDIGDTVNATEQNEMRDAAGKLTAAGIYTDTLADVYEIQIPDATAWDEVGASVSNKGVFVFVKNNDDRRREYVEVPAIATKFVTPGSKVLNTQNTDVQNFIAKTLAVLNKRFSLDADKFRFEKAYYSDRKGAGKRQSVIPEVVDPSGVTPTP